MRIQCPKKHPWYRRNCKCCSCQSRNRPRLGTGHKADKTASPSRVVRCRPLHNRHSSTGCRKTVSRCNANGQYRTGTKAIFLWMWSWFWSRSRVHDLQHTTDTDYGLGKVIKIKMILRNLWYLQKYTCRSCQSRNHYRFGTRYKADNTASMFRVLRCRLLHNGQSSTGCCKTLSSGDNANGMCRTGTMREILLLCLWPWVCAFQLLSLVFAFGLWQRNFAFGSWSLLWLRPRV